MFNILLLIFSILIYASFGIENLIYILISVITTFYTGKKINHKKNKTLLIFTIILNLSIFIFFKFYQFNNFFGIYENISLFIPLGIAYYTLQSISYLIDVYRNKIEAEKNFLIYCIYMFYFPYLFIGPINRYGDIRDSIYNKKRFKKENLQNGIIRILWGLFKKLIIAGRISIIINNITLNYNYNGAYILLSCLLYSILLYSDFSGGTDMVLGVSKILGIELKENFNSPYLSQNLKEFWKRWHISLSSWLRDYIYIPLGGNRSGKFRNKLNIIITFTISGLWHGVNYILWGFIHGVMLIIENDRKTKFKFLNIIFNYIIISLSWIFFIYPIPKDSIQMFITIFINNNILEMFSNLLNLGLSFTNYIVLIISVIILFIYDYNKIKIINKIKNYSSSQKLFITCSLIIILIVFGVYGIGFNVDDFIYSKF